MITKCIEAKIDYLDFADAADFVFGVSQFDAPAKAAGVFVLSGVSSFPVLTAAVLRHMAKRMDIIAVEGGIAPSPLCRDRPQCHAGGRRLRPPALALALTARGRRPPKQARRTSAEGWPKLVLRIVGAPQSITIDGLRDTIYADISI